MPDIGYSVTIQVSDAAPATTPTNAIGGVTAFTPPNFSRDVIDVTTTASANLTREFIGGLIDPGEASFSILWDSGNTVDTLLRAMLLERLPRTWRITFNQYSPARTVTFSGILSAYERDTPMEDKMTATMTVKVSGSVVTA